MFASACKHSRGKKRTPLRSQTHTRVNQEAEEGTHRGPASHTGAQPGGLAPTGPHGAGGCSASSPRPSTPPLPRSWNAGAGQVRRVSGLQKAKDPGRDTRGSCTRSRVPPGSGGHLLKVTARERPLAPPARRAEESMETPSPPEVGMGKHCSTPFPKHMARCRFPREAQLQRKACRFPRGWADSPPSNRSLRLPLLGEAGRGGGGWDEALGASDGARAGAPAPLPTFPASVSPRQGRPASALASLGTFSAYWSERFCHHESPVTSLLCTEPSSSFRFVSHKLGASTASRVPCIAGPASPPLFGSAHPTLSPPATPVPLLRLRHTRSDPASEPC